MTDSDYVKILCADFDDRYVPLSEQDFWDLYNSCGKSVEELVNCGSLEVDKLLERSESAMLKLEEIAQYDFHLVSFLDEGFPMRLRYNLGDECPPVLYMFGNPELANETCLAIVGKKGVIETGEIIHLAASKGIGTCNYCLDYKLWNTIVWAKNCILFFPDCMIHEVEQPWYPFNHSLFFNNLLVYSHVYPLVGCKPFRSYASYQQEVRKQSRKSFKYMVAFSSATLVMDCDDEIEYDGVIDAYHNFEQIFVWDDKDNKKNQELISKPTILPVSKYGKILVPNMCGDIFSYVNPSVDYYCPEFFVDMPPALVV